MGLNKSQLAAVCHGDGPMLVLAGPGSGKTRVITERTRRLISECGVDPARILVITFTKAAAREMKERFLSLAGPSGGAVTFGTFHAVFFSVLKHAYGYRAESIVREDQKAAIVRGIIGRMGIECDDALELAADAIAEIGLVKNIGADPAAYKAKCCGEEDFRQIYHEYHEHLYRNRLLDFEDMLVYTKELFCERGDILSAWQKKFGYILIDEFQDINRIQFDVVKLLAGSRQNVFAVGDDDQSIYRFRGAMPELMLHFEDDFPGTKKVLLDVNYRSTQRIVSRAQRVIGHNKSRFEKKIRAAGEPGAEVECAIFENQKEEGMRIIRDLMELGGRGGNLDSVAVLYRTNAQPRTLVRLLLSYGIPFYSRDAVPSLYDHWAARDILCYLRIAMGGRSRRDFLQIMNRPKRYISRESLEDEEVAFDAWEERLGAQPWVARRVERLESDIRLLSGMKPYAAVNYIRKGIGYDEFCVEYAEYRHLQLEDVYDVLDELQDAARGAGSIGEWLDQIREQERLLRQEAAKKDAEKSGVALATLHSSKGLEYDEVYVIDANEGVMPYEKAELEEEIEEERRMFYVGMTRAKKSLHLFCVRQMRGRESSPSRFLGEAGFKLQ